MGRQSQPGRHLPAIAKLMTVANCCQYGRGCQLANPWDLFDLHAQPVVLEQGFDPMVYCGDLAIKLHHAMVLLRKRHPPDLGQ